MIANAASPVELSFGPDGALYYPDFNGGRIMRVAYTAGDSAPPSVSLTGPAAGAQVSGTVSVSADAADNVGVTGVQFKLDGTSLGAEDTVAPFTINWNTTTATNGQHTLTAVARDAAGNTTTSAARTVTVSNSGGLTCAAGEFHAQYFAEHDADGSGRPRAVRAGDRLHLGARQPRGCRPDQFSARWSGSISFPAGSTTFTATADDGIRVLVDGVAVINAWVDQSTTTYTATRVLSAGTHQITVEYYENGADATARVTWTTTTAGDSAPPSVSLTGPAAGAQVSGTVSVSADAADNVGVTGVQFRLDGTSLGAEDTVAPFTINWNTTTATNGQHTLTAVARDAAGNTTTSAARTVTVSNSGGLTCAAGEFHAQYFENMTLTAPAALERCEQAINYIWGLGSPTGVRPDQFSARWSGSISFPAGSTTFTATADDGIRVLVDGVAVINAWVDQSTTTYTATRVLSAGTHQITVEYYENGADATARVTWTTTTANEAPSVAIASPGSGTTFAVDDDVTFRATATDPEDGELPVDWQVRIQHCPSNCHSHTYETFDDVPSGESRSFAYPDHEYPSHVELVATVTDADGATATASLDLYPKTVDLTLTSVPEGLNLAFGPDVDVTPFTRTVMVGSNNSLSAFSPQTLGGGSFAFSSWSDGGAASHNITAPATATTYTATFTASNSPPTASIVATPPSGAAPLTVTLDGTGSTDPDAGDTLAYSWDLDDDGDYGDSIVSAPQVLFDTPGDQTVRLRVTDQHGASDEASIVVTVDNTPPTAAIAAPGAAQTWAVGDTISFSGGGSDAQDGTLAPSALSWELVLHPCATTCAGQVVATADGVASGSFTAPPSAGYPSYLILRLVATDSHGAQTPASLRLDPRTTQLTFASAPPGLSLEVEGAAATAPFNRTVIVGEAVDVRAPSPQSSGGSTHTFSSWSDGGAASHTITAPGADTTYTATFATSVQSSLVAAFNFDETTGPTVFDSSGKGNNGTISGATRISGGKNGRALRFDGTNDWVTIADAASLDLTGGMTLEAWVYPVSLGNRARSVITKEGTGARVYGLDANRSNRRPRGVVNVGGEQGATGTAQLRLVAWTHLAVTYDGSTLRLYVNGIESTTRALSGPIATSGGALRIGGNALGTEWFNGRIDDVRVYASARTPSEITADMNTAVTAGGGAQTRPAVAAALGLAGLPVLALVVRRRRRRSRH